VIPPIAGSPDGGARAVSADFEALILQSAFAPLAKSMGFYGDVVVGIATRALLRSPSDDFANTLERALSLP
jgi:hypothetical protein